MSDEEAPHRTLRPERQLIMRDKKALLFKRMCADLLFRRMCADAGVEDRIQLARRGEVLPALRGKVQACQDDRSAGDDRSADEVAQGFLQGPFTQADLSARLGPLYVISKRFGIRQGERCRPIDDWRPA